MIILIKLMFRRRMEIEESDDSIIGQSFRDWELFIVDDGSTGKTVELACRFEEADPRIRVIRNETNRKLPASLNKGLCSLGRAVSDMDFG